MEQNLQKTQLIGNSTVSAKSMEYLNRFIQSQRNSYLNRPPRLKIVRGSNMTEATAFSPGHITGLFQVFDQSEDPLLQGSRGAGVSITQGVTTSNLG